MHITRNRRGRTFVSLLVLFAVAAALAQPVLAANGSVSYTYDALGRLVSAQYDTGVILTYTYDANGNRLSQVVTVAAGKTTWGTSKWGQSMW